MFVSVEDVVWQHSLRNAFHTNSTSLLDYRIDGKLADQLAPDGSRPWTPAAVEAARRAPRARPEWRAPRRHSSRSQIPVTCDQWSSWMSDSDTRNQGLNTGTNFDFGIGSGLGTWDPPLWYMILHVLPACLYSHSLCLVTSKLKVSSNVLVPVPVQCTGNP